MKKLTYLLCLAGLLATVSCKDDDGGEPGPVSNTFTVDGKNFVAKSGVIEDYGSDGTDVDGDGENDFYNYDFYITDANIVQKGDSYEVEGNSSMLVYVETYSPSGSSFKPGTFNFSTGENPAKGDYMFVAAYLVLDKNNSGTVGDEILNSDYSEVTAGKVTISGSNRNYTVAFDVTLENNKKLTGSYAGNFAYTDNRSGERAPGEDLRMNRGHKLRLK